LTLAPHCPGVFATVTFDGHVIDGAWVSLTVTVNEHMAVLPLASVAVQETVVVPIGKNEPDAGEQTTAVLPEQLSAVVGVAKLTFAPHCPASFETVTFEGHVIDGAWVSLTVTVKVQVVVLSSESLAVHVTVVVPTAKVEPDAGEQTTVVSPPQLSVAVGVA
jgi:hypothetical protein